MIIGVSGKIGSGKDTFAKLFQHTRFNPLLGRTEIWHNKKFAGKLKQIVSILSGFSVEDLEKQEIKDTVLGPEWDKYFITDFGRKIGTYFCSEQEAIDFCSGSNSQHQFGYEKESITVRWLLQVVGTECGRQIIHENIWVNALMSEYRYMCDNGGVVRYPNWIITDVRFPNEADSIKKMGGVLVRVIRTGVKSSNHKSETALDGYQNWDYVVDNSGTIEYLNGIVKYISDKIVL